MTKAEDPVVEDVQELEGGVVVKLVGEIDYSRSPKLLETLDGLVQKRPPRLVIDLARVGHMDSSGLGTLVKVFQQVNTYQGKMALVGMNDRVRNLLEITRLDKFFLLCPTVDEALEA